MITMELYEYIRYSYHNLNKSINAISKLTGKDWRTVKKAVSGEEPKYKMKKARPKPMMDPYEQA